MASGKMPKKWCQQNLTLVYLITRNKEWFLIEGTVCLLGTIPARTMFKRDKYADLRIGVNNLYSGHKVSGIDVIFDFLVAYSTHLENELTKILHDKKVVSKTIEKSQKWIISQNCEIVK